MSETENMKLSKEEVKVIRKLRNSDDIKKIDGKIKRAEKMIEKKEAEVKKLKKLIVAIENGTTTYKEYQEKQKAEAEDKVEQSE